MLCTCTYHLPQLQQCLPVEQLQLVLYIHTCTSYRQLSLHSVRKEVLHKAGRCYMYLRKGHLPIHGKLQQMSWKIYSTVCPHTCRNDNTTNSSTTLSGPIIEGANQVSDRPTNVSYIDLQTPSLLPTAKLQLYSLNNTMDLSSYVEARAVMDN